MLECVITIPWLYLIPVFLFVNIHYNFILAKELIHCTQDVAGIAKNLRAPERGIRWYNFLDLFRKYVYYYLTLVTEW